MKQLMPQQLQHFFELEATAFSGWILLLMVCLFALFALLLCKRAYALHRTLRLLRTSFSEGAMQNSPLLRQYWQEYAHTFLLDLQENNKTQRDAAEFFTPERIVGDVLCIRRWRFAPHVFFGVGMVAVLAQLVLGLVLFDFASPEAIMHSVQHAFMAIANGFVCLVGGLLCSLGMYFILRWLYGALSRQVQAFAAQLNQRYRITTLQERELTLAEYAKTLTRIVTTLFSDPNGGKPLTPGALSRALIEQSRHTNRLLLQRAGNLSTEQLQELGQAAGRGMAEELQPLLEGLRREEPPSISGSGIQGAHDAAALAAALHASSLALREYLKTQQGKQKHGKEEFDETLGDHPGPRQ